MDIRPQDQAWSEGDVKLKYRERWTLAQPQTDCQTNAPPHRWCNAYREGHLRILSGEATCYAFQTSTSFGNADFSKRALASNRNYCCLALE